MSSRRTRSQCQAATHWLLDCRTARRGRAGCRRRERRRRRPGVQAPQVLSDCLLPDALLRVVPSSTRHEQRRWASNGGARARHGFEESVLPGTRQQRGECMP